MKQLFAYIRVSTAKQGQGVSLQEQRAAIERFAAKSGAEITEWFEEKKTAAKTGRPEFARMVKLLRGGKAAGVVIHKIDRSTRNYRDWADIDELIEAGIEVHFANESLDLNSRGGRLAADVQVVVAVDYIRNLREEALKGIEGRLKQGILPRHAPIGYLDCGAGKPKAIDPVRGLIIRRLFEVYASGSSTLRDLTQEAITLGLRNRKGNPLRLKQIHCILRNPFYVGIIKSARFGVFAGAHEPIVRHALFDRVQQVLSGKLAQRSNKHFFLFRRLMRCGTCGRALIGSLAKGNVYYRCSTISCPTTSVREDSVDAAVQGALQAITLNDVETAWVETELAAGCRDSRDLAEKRRVALLEALAAANARLKRLTGLLLDDKIDPATHDEAREQLVMDRHTIEGDLSRLQDDGVPSAVGEIVELARAALILYQSADDDRKRQLLEIVTSNFVVTRKEIGFSLREPFATLEKRSREQPCRPDCHIPPTSVIENLILWGSRLEPRLVDNLKDLLRFRKDDETNAA